MHDRAVFARCRFPLPALLLRQVDLQPAREGEHEAHDVGGDVVVIDLAEIGDLDRVGDQLRVVVAGRRRRLRRLQPAQLLRFRQQIGRDRAVGRLRQRHHLLGALAGFGDDHFQLGVRGRDALAPVAALVALWRQHQQGDGHVTSP